MTRVLLAVVLCVLTLSVGLWTCVVASHNHERAATLARLQRTLEMRRTANAQLESMAAAHVWGGSSADGSAREAAPEDAARFTEVAP